MGHGHGHGHGHGQEQDKKAIKIENDSLLFFQQTEQFEVKKKKTFGRLTQSWWLVVHDKNWAKVTMKMLSIEIIEKYFTEICATK